ncbi:uncharacterized protein LOC23687724 [Aedes aegypti]|uniref:Gustatory receptor n=1 Tax=Aedes aegypti TaxID=7159 RepID=A0A6I8TR77_AEDAE|nr:gustatory receptor 15 [Aedes aegypti]
MAKISCLYRHVLKIFQLFGYHCFTIDSNRNCRYWIVCWLINVLCGIFLTIFIYCFQYSILYSDSDLGYIVDFTKFVVNFGVYFCFLIESFYYRNVFIRLWSDLQIIENSVCKWITHWSRNEKEVLNEFWKIFFSFFTYLVFWDIFYALVICPVIRSSNFTLIFLVIFSLTHLRQFLVLFYTKLIAYYLNIVKRQMHFIQSQSSALGVLDNLSYDIHLIKDELRSVADVCARLDQIVLTLNKIIGFSLFIIKIREHAHLLTDSYWIIFRILNGGFLRSLFLILSLSSKYVCLVINFHAVEHLYDIRKSIQNISNGINFAFQNKSNFHWQTVESYNYRIQWSRTMLSGYDMFGYSYSTMFEICLSVLTSVAFLTQMADRTYEN